MVKKEDKKINYKRIVVLVIVLAVIVLSIITRPNNGKGNTAAECNANEDCVKVRTTCCSCHSGGEEKCVPKNEEEAYNDLLKDCSQNIFCTAVYNCKIESCSCEAGKCTG